MGGFVYILSSKSGVLYGGVTSELATRILQHKLGKFPGFTEKYKVNRLVYFQHFGSIPRAIAREKEIKGWRRSKKIALIESTNPSRTDQSATFIDIHPISKP